MNKQLHASEPNSIRELCGLLLQVMVKRLGMDAILWPKSGKYERFTKLVLGTESLTGHRLHQ